jgi:hypothetical protein
MDTVLIFDKINYEYSNFSGGIVYAVAANANQFIVKPTSNSLGIAPYTNDTYDVWILTSSNTVSTN